MFNNSYTYTYRLLIAALHFNENYDREQAKTKDGAERIKISFPKQKQGGFTPKPVPVPKTYRKLLIHMYFTLFKYQIMYHRLC